MMMVPVETEPALRAGKPTVLFDDPSFHGRFDAGPYYDVAADGRFVMVQHRRTPGFTSCSTGPRSSKRACPRGGERTHLARAEA
jgi:hypothetical protein